MNTTPTTYNALALAVWLLREAASNTSFNAPEHDDITRGTDADPSLMDAALDSIQTGDTLAAVEWLACAAKMASKPPEPPTTGRNRLDRHQFNTQQRKNLLNTLLMPVPWCWMGSRPAVQREHHHPPVLPRCPAASGAA